MNEELLNTNHAVPSNSQTAFVQEFCARAEERIRAARSFNEARTITVQACMDFSSECNSDLLARALREMLNDRIEHIWKARHDHP